VFSNLINLLKSAVSLVIDGVRSILGNAASSQADAELLTNRITSTFVVAAALVLLFIPGLRQWSDHLFRVGLQIWKSATPIPAGKVL